MKEEQVKEQLKAIEEFTKKACESKESATKVLTNMGLIIPNDIKARVFAQYLGQKCKEIKSDEIHQQEYYVEDVKLILKPLLLISIEDATEVMRMHKSITANDGTFLTEYSPMSKIVKFIATVKVFRHDVYQFLQSKGYDLPNYHLNGQTLHEAGLCLYE